MIPRTIGEIRSEIVRLEANARELERNKKFAEAASQKIRAFALRWALGISPTASAIHLSGIMTDRIGA